MIEFYESTVKVGCGEPEYIPETLKAMFPVLETIGSDQCFLYKFVPMRKGMFKAQIRSDFKLGANDSRFIQRDYKDGHRLKLRAQISTNVSQTSSGKPLYHQGAQAKSYISGLMGRRGFSVSKIELGEKEYMNIGENHDPALLAYFKATFSGQITDIGSFEKALLDGIGAGRSNGLGMLTILSPPPKVP